MERQIPKNVRQIGNVSGSPKIYVEDYVDTFFTQLCEKAGENPVGAFLVGDIQKVEEEEYVYIYGAIRMQELKLSGIEYVIDEETWKRAYEDCKQYFEDGEMLGWFVAHPGVPLTPESSTVKLHKKSFPKKNTVFIMKDPVEKEEVYYVHKFNDLLEVSGHYTYYEKNPCMQNYMISTRKKNGVTPSETVEDRAAKDFRSLVRTREERQQQKRANRAMYMMSACLVLVVIIMGVVTMNNFDKMQSVQNMLSSLSDSVVPDDDSGAQNSEENITSGDDADNPGDGDGSSGEVQANSGNVTAITGTDGQVSEGGNEGDPAMDGNTAGIGSTENQDSGDNASDTPDSGDDQNNNGSADTDNVYVVEEGDTLATISQKIYGDISQVQAISEMNGLTDGNLIYVGQKLLLP